MDYDFFNARDQKELDRLVVNRINRRATLEAAAQRLQGWSSTSILA